MALTVGELRKALEGLPDDVHVTRYTHPSGLQPFTRVITDQFGVDHHDERDDAGLSKVVFHATPVVIIS